MTESSDHQTPETDNTSPAQKLSFVALIRWIDFGVAAFGVAAVAFFLILLAQDNFNSRRPAKRTICRNNLWSIALGLQQYHDEYDSFPPAYVADEQGRPMHSWRVLMLPYLDRPDLYKRYRFDEPWNGPNNSKLAEYHVRVFQCPGDKDVLPTETSYLAVVGPNTVWPGSKSIRLVDIKDGPSNTILLVEVANSGINWMEPRDLEVDKLPLQINPAEDLGISSHHKGGANVVFCDAEMKFLSDDLPDETLRRLLEINDGEELGDY